MGEIKQFSETDIEVVKVTQGVSAIVQKATVLTVTSDPECITATEILGSLKTELKKVEDTRGFFVKGLNEQVKKINGFFKQCSTPLEEADRIVRGKVIKYRQDCEAKRQVEQKRLDDLAAKEQERLNKLAEKQQVKADKLAENSLIPAPKIDAPKVATSYIPPQATTIESSTAKVSFKKVWRHKIIDENKIPREYLMVNESAIRQAIKDGIREIAGVEIKQVEDPSVRC